MSNQYLDSEGLKILNQDINERREQDLNNLADTYDSTLTYSVGDLVIRDYKLWKCKTAISTAEAWNESRWEQITLNSHFENYFGFKRIPIPADLNNLTDEEIAAIEGGAFVAGEFSNNVLNPVFLPASHKLGNIKQGLMIASYASPHGKKLSAFMRWTINGRALGFDSAYPPHGLFFEYEFDTLSAFFPTINIDTNSKITYGGNRPDGRKILIASVPNDANAKTYYPRLVNGVGEWYEQTNNLAPEYDATATYAVGDVCIHDGALYQCTTVIATAEAWDTTHWTQVKVDDVYADKNYFGFKRIPAPASTTLTNDEKIIFQQGCIVDGAFLGYNKSIFFPGSSGITHQGLFIGEGTYGTEIRQWYFVGGGNQVGLRDEKISLSSFNRNIALTAQYIYLHNRRFPNYPADTTTPHVLQTIGTGIDSVTWTPIQYGPSVSDNTLTELTYEKISVLSLSADKTFTLKTAQTDCIPEYKALITNSGSSAITLTFTGVGTIHTNDPNIVLVAGTNSTATIPANTKVEVNIFDGDAIVYNKNAISYATNAEVEALFN